MADWDPTLGLGDPRRLDAQDAFLSTLEPALHEFARRNAAVFEANYHGQPNRRVYKIFNDGTTRLIHIMPMPSLGDEPEACRVCVAGMIWLDEAGTRFSLSAGGRRMFEGAEVQQELSTILQKIWTELQRIERTELQRRGERSRLSQT